MSSKETYMGSVEDVNGSTVRISLSRQSLTGFVYIEGQGYRVGQIGSFIRIPIGFVNLYGIVSQVGASAVPENKREDNPSGNRWMTIQLIGEGQRSGVFQRGLSQYPTIGDEVHLVSEKELKNIYGEPDKPYFVKLGHISNAESISALVDINKLITRHSAVVGTTGSGKSTAVASIMNALSDVKNYPSARILILDIHGEYGSALKDMANIYKVNPDTSDNSYERELHIPFWALNSEELCDLSFGKFDNEKERNILLERIHKSKIDSLQNYPKNGANVDSLSVDSPIPFSLHSLWGELFTETFGTYYKKKGGIPSQNLAYGTSEKLPYFGIIGSVPTSLRRPHEPADLCRSRVRHQEAQDSPRAVSGEAGSIAALEAARSPDCQALRPRRHGSPAISAIVHAPRTRHAAGVQPERPGHGGRALRD